MKVVQCGIPSISHTCIIARSLFQAIPHDTDTDTDTDITRSDTSRYHSPFDFAPWMLLALVELIRMLKRRASKRFVLVESGEDNATASGSGSSSSSGTGTGSSSDPVIPHFVAVDCGQDEANNNNGEMSASISNHSSANINNGNQMPPSSSLLAVPGPPVGTLK